MHQGSVQQLVSHAEAFSALSSGMLHMQTEGLTKQVSLSDSPPGKQDITVADQTTPT